MKKALFLVLVIIFLFGCVSPDAPEIPIESEGEAPAEVEEGFGEPEIHDVPTSEAEPPVETEPMPTEEPVEVVEDSVAEEDNDKDIEEEIIETNDSQQEVPEESVYIPTEEVFVTTFSQVEEIIQELNQIIRRRDFETWTQYLTDEYREYLSRESVLQEINQRPVIQNRGLKVESLQDYFLHVVVPSRANLRLDDLYFVTDTQVQAIMNIGDVRVTLYQLILQNGNWKIGEF